MRYAVVDVEIAESLGFSKTTHRIVPQGMILNEKEIMVSPSMKGTLNERVNSIQAVLYTESGLHRLINII